MGVRGNISGGRRATNWVTPFDPLPLITNILCMAYLQRFCEICQLLGHKKQHTFALNEKF